MNEIIYYYASIHKTVIPYLLKRIFLSSQCGLFAKKTGDNLAYVFAFPIVIPVIAWFFLNITSLFRKMRNRKIRVVGLLLLCSLVLYFLAPWGIHYAWVAPARFSIFFMLSLILLGSVMYPKKMEGGNKVYIVIFCSIYFLMWAQYFVEFNRENRSFTQDFFPEESKDKLLAGLIYDYAFRGNAAYIHFPNYYIIWKKGIACNKFIDYPGGSVVKRKADQKSLPDYNEWVGRHNNYGGSYAGIDYILVRGTVTEEGKRHLSNFVPVKEAGAWTLLKNNRIQ